MKKFLFRLAALAVCFTSCDQTPEPPKDKINYLESLKVMAAFISDNYTEGDSVIFYNESSNLLDTFVVSHSQTLAVIQPTDTNFTNNEELGYFIYDTLSVESFVIMQNKEYVIDAAFAIGEKPLAFIGICKSLENLDFQKIRTDLDMPLLMSGVTEYTITNTAGQSCYLRKNEGIISFSDEKGNTWTKK